MNRRNFMQSLAATTALPFAAPALSAPVAVDTRPSHRPIQPWYSQDGLGLFICWGISSVAAIEIGWGLFEDAGKPNPYWPPEKYDALADKFNPQNYDPNLWMEAAVRAGFKYCVFLNPPPRWLRTVAKRLRRLQHPAEIGRPGLGAALRRGVPEIRFEGRVLLLTERLALQPARLAASGLLPARRGNAPLASAKPGDSQVRGYAYRRNPEVL